MLQTPWVEVAAPDFYMYDFDLAQVTANLDVSLIVRGHLDDAQSKRLYGRLQTFGEALIDCLIQPQAFGQLAVVRELRGTYPINPADPASTGPQYAGWALIVLTLETAEQRSIL